MNDYAATFTKATTIRRGGIQLSYPVTRKQPTRSNDKTVIGPEKRKTLPEQHKTPLTRNKSIVSSVTASSFKTKDSTKLTVDKKRKKNSKENYHNDNIDRLRSNTNSSPVMQPKNKKHKSQVITTIPSTPNEEIASLKDQFQAMLDRDAKREKEAKDALKAKDEEIKELLRQKDIETNEKQSKELQKQRLKHQEEVDNLKKALDEVLRQTELAAQRAKQDSEKEQRKKDDEAKEKDKKDNQDKDQQIENLKKSLEEVQRAVERVENDRLKREADDAIQLKKKEKEEKERVRKERDEALRRQMEETNINAANEFKKLQENLQKSQDLTMQRLFIVEEEIKFKRKLEEEKERQELLRHQMALEREHAVQTELTFLAQKEAFAAQEFKRKKEEHDECQRLRAEKDLELRKQQLALDVAQRKEQDAAAKAEFEMEELKEAEHQRKLESKRFK